MSLPIVVFKGPVVKYDVITREKDEDVRMIERLLASTAVLCSVLL